MVADRWKQGSTGAGFCRSGVVSGGGVSAGVSGFYTILNAVGPGSVAVILVASLAKAPESTVTG